MGTQSLRGVRSVCGVLGVAGRVGSSGWHLHIGICSTGTGRRHPDLGVSWNMRAVAECRGPSWGTGTSPAWVLETECGEKGFCTGERTTAKMRDWLHKRGLFL